jgi:nitroimidazol reductase NimA-like FMN-containing flavoprotein (pyridoxamine 5'-phosphate oxidase superfamily)
VTDGTAAADPFDIDAFLARPLVARVATAAPRVVVRPVWYQWEGDCFWWLTGPWSRLPVALSLDPRVALVVDSCEVSTGETRQVSARGTAEVVPNDIALTYRKLARYLGDDRPTWDPRFRAYLVDADASLVRLAPERLVAVDLSFRPSGPTTAQPASRP